eukprot:c27496_g1_i1.p1 GENE.c27496_g1_i1~~c27496_g1_i1.p1  ORF type:complete len:486 (+),score=167.05 c27496_g1_i1:45-1502(+)
MDFLRRVQFYQRVHEEFTDVTTATGVISIFSFVTMMFLFFFELVQYLHVKTDTTLVMDTNASDKIIVNFNITMTYLPCRFASVDVSDRHGEHYANITSSITKWRVISHLDGSHQKLGYQPIIERRIEERTATALLLDVPMNDPSVNHYVDGENEAIEITPDNFEAQLKIHDLSLINFFAPWCIWSNRLKPAWEHTAKLLKDNKRVLIGKCDCTAEKNRKLCQENHIMAFPTIRIYRLGSTHSHEYYNQERQASAFLEFIDHELTHIQGSVVPKDPEDTRIRVMPSPAHLPPEEPQSLEDTSLNPEGCMISGHILVDRAPGNFHIEAKSGNHSFNSDSLNTTHFVSSLTFGEIISKDQLRRLHKSIIPFMDTLNNTFFTSETYGTTREHNLKIVHTTNHDFHGKISSTYQFTATSTEYVEHPPSAKFSFDFSPIQVIVKQYRNPLSSFVISLCAIIGGVFTMIGIFDSAVYHTLKIFSKKTRGLIP